jgi:Fur family iron response transcriptional regulator
MSDGVAQTLLKHGIQPSAQRLAVAAVVLHTDSHPSADQVLALLRNQDASVSRATVYNTLHLFVQRGLLRELTIAEGRVVFDPRTEPHHHFVDDETGAVSDLPLSAFSIEQHEALDGVVVRNVEVVVRGRRC